MTATGLEPTTTTDWRFTLKRVHDMIRTYSYKDVLLDKKCLRHSMINGSYWLAFTCSLSTSRNFWLQNWHYLYWDYYNSNRRFFAVTPSQSKSSLCRIQKWLVNFLSILRSFENSRANWSYAGALWCRIYKFIQPYLFRRVK